MMPTIPRCASLNVSSTSSNVVVMMSEHNLDKYIESEKIKNLI